MNFKLLSKECFIASPGPNVYVNATTYYAERSGLRLMSLHQLASRSDTVDVAHVRFSDDNGRTWGPAQEVATRFDDPNGTGRRHPRGGYADPGTGRFLTLWTEGVLPTDNPKEGMRLFKIHYAVSHDGGRTTRFSGQVIHEGSEFSAAHPLPGVNVGKNCYMIGDFGSRPVTREDGVILVPFHSSPAGPDGDYWNPHNALTYTDAVILMGRWTPEGGLRWTCSERIKGDPDRTTRGLFEPTLGQLADGRWLVVMRGSNHRKPELPSYRWRAVSGDGGQTWSQPEPWTYDDGAPFFSPSSCSQLVPWRDGRLFWIGNISAENAQANRPRYPLYIGEVDRESGLLIRDSLRVIDDRQPGEHENMTLSNFCAREDRETGHLLLHMSRLFTGGPRGSEPDWTADALLYRMEV